MGAPQLGRIGIWSMECRFGDPAESNEAAAEMEELGYGALWIPGGIDDAVLGDVERLLNATNTIAIATGILNIWKHDPADVAAWFKALPEAQQSRVMLGIGVSHGPIIGEAWEKPLAKTRGFLDGLDAAGMPRENVCVAALGPKMLALSGERSAGAHPYLVTPEHSRRAREILGPGKLLAPEQGVVLETDREKSRELAVAALDHYRFLPNYRNNWLRLGISEADIDGLTDALLDALFARGDAAAIGARLEEHFAAGADHVCMQVIAGATGGPIPEQRARWRTLAQALL